MGQKGRERATLTTPVATLEIGSHLFSRVMLIVTPQRLKQSPNLNLYINVSKLENVIEFLYLGVILDSCRLKAECTCKQDL